MKNLAKQITDHMWSIKATVLAVLITSGKQGEMWRRESMIIQTPLMTLNLSVTYGRIRPILLVGKCTAQTFPKRRIIEGLMIQQWSPSLNKQVHCYVAKLFPSGITLSI